MQQLKIYKEKIIKNEEQQMFMKRKNFEIQLSALLEDSLILSNLIKISQNPAFNSLDSIFLSFMQARKQILQSRLINHDGKTLLQFKRNPQNKILKNTESFEVLNMNEYLGNIDHKILEKNNFILIGSFTNKKNPKSSDSSAKQLTILTTILDNNTIKFYFFLELCGTQMLTPLFESQDRNNAFFLTGKGKLIHSLKANPEIQSLLKKEILKGLLKKENGVLEYSNKTFIFNRFDFFLDKNIGPYQVLSQEKWLYFIQLPKEKLSPPWHPLLLPFFIFGSLLLASALLYFSFHHLKQNSYHRELESSRKRLDAISKSIQDILFIFDTSGNIFYISSSASHFLPNFAINPVLQNISEIFPKVLSEWLPKIKNTQENIFFLSLTDKENSIVPFEIQINYLEDYQNLYIAVMRNITKRKLTDKKLQLMSNALEEAADIIFITNPEGNIEYANKAFERITGFNRESVQGKNPKILKSGKMSPEYYSQVWKTLLKGKTYRGIVINKCKNGNLFYYDQTIAPLKNENGEIINFISTGKDVSDKIESDKKLQNQRDLFIYFIRNIPASVIMINLKGICLVCSRRWELDFFNSEDPANHHYTEFTHSKGLTYWVTLLQQVISGKENNRTETTYVLKTGREEWIESEFLPWKDENDEITGAIVYCNIITEQKKIKERNQKINENLESIIKKGTQELQEVNSRLMEKEEHERLLKNIASTANTAESIEKILQTSIKSLSFFMNWSVAHVYLPDEKKQQLYSAGIWYFSDKEKFIKFKQATEDSFFSYGQGLPGRVFSLKLPYWVPELKKFPECPRAEAAKEEGILTAFAFPVVNDDQIDAVLEFFSTSAVEITEKELTLSREIGIQLGYVIKRKKAETALRLSEERLNKAFEGAGYGWWDWNLKNRMIITSPRKLEMLGYTDEDPSIPKNVDWWISLIHPDDYDETMKRMREHITGKKEHYVMEYRLKTKNGDWKWMADRGKVTEFDDQGKAVRMIGAIEDISERKKYEAEMISARQKAEEASMTKSTFLANMSHEIRTPLNAIIGLSHLLLDSSLSPRETDYVNKIFSSSHSLLAIINDILDFSKMEAGKLQLEYTVFSLNDLLKSIENIHSLKIQEKGLVFHLIVKSDVPEFFLGDLVRLSQVLNNLLSNAVKFTEKGHIILRISRIIDQKHLFYFEVIDSGIGIQKNQQTNLFRSFSQADESTSRKYGGTGLGLSISRKIIKLMGGEINVESEYNKGSRFYFHIPLSPKEKSIHENQKLNRSVYIISQNSWILESLQESLDFFKIDYFIHSSFSEIPPLTHKTNKQNPLLIIDNHSLETLSLQDKELFEKSSFLKIILTPSEKILNKYREKHNCLYLPLRRNFLYQELLRISHLGLSSTSENQNKEKKSKVYSALINKHVLLVENNAVNQLVAKDILENAGLIVSIANNGAEACQQVDQKHFDAVLMDIKMPVLDGYQATHEIRKKYSTTELPIIAMTAKALSSDKEKSLEEGMNDHINKPIEPQDLFNCLLKWLSNTKQEEQIQDAVFQELPEKNIFPIDGINTNKTLKKLGNNSELYINILDNFQKTLKNIQEELLQKQNLANFKQMKSELHTLKGVSGNVGADEIHHLCILAEEDISAAREIDPETINSHLDDLNKEINKVMKSLNHFFTVKEEKSFLPQKEFDKIQIKTSLLLLKNMHYFLKEGNMEILNELDYLKKEIPDIFSENLFQLRKEIKNYNFEKAAEINQKLIKSLNDVSITMEEDNNE